MYHKNNTNISLNITMISNRRVDNEGNIWSKDSLDPINQIETALITFSAMLIVQGKVNRLFKLGLSFELYLFSSNCSRWTGRFKLQVTNIIISTHDSVRRLLFIENTKRVIILKAPIESHKISPIFRWMFECIKKRRVKVVNDNPIWIKYIRIRNIFSLMLRALFWILAT